MKKRISLKILIPAAVSALALLVSLFSWLALLSERGALTTQSAAERWSGESELRFAQVSVFLPKSAELNEENIAKLRSSLDARFVSEAIEAPEGGNLMNDAYFADGGTVSAAGEYGSAQVRVCGVGGDFFFFHPMRLCCGVYISGDELMHDRAVLDTNAAWRLFGGTDVAGQSITVDGSTYLVAGVVERESDRYSEKVRSDGAEIYLYFDALAAKNEKLSVTCYEAVLPNPVSGFAAGLVAELFPVSGGETVENSARYDIISLYGVLKNRSERTVRLNDIPYPDWENAARLSENRAAALLPPLFLPLIAPLAVIVFAAVHYARRFSAEMSERVRKYREFG